MKRKKVIAAGAAVVAAAGVFAGVTATASHAAIPDANGDITLCAWDQPSYQILHVVQPDAGYTCPTGYKIFKIHQNGNPGPTGPAGPTGPPGAPGSLSTIQVTATDTSPTVVGTEGPNNIYSYVPVATCPDGYVATGGGWKSSTVGASVPQAGYNGPTSNGLGWQGHLRTSNGAGSLDVGVTVICALGTTS